MYVCMYNRRREMKLEKWKDLDELRRLSRCSYKIAAFLGAV